ncbi:SrfA family protein [Yersinia frederiksenii]|uniref:SrfA family protein n=1 Tax=Yersinia frederiksenii TaxID=29484 RepID=UPI0005E60004|nr:SrfA family protein [Yersinia frederiksenii]CFR27060.1 virulence factor [Yersinia frederiksenii]
MVKPLLRSGVRSHYLALGENGQLVFDSALQIREALRLRGLQAVADCLAIPQCHHEGERIDWYAPRRGAVTPWASANASLRQQALDDLLHCRAKVEALRTLATNAENLTLRMLAMLLKHVFQFPGAQYIWLQNGKPVIAFWGFTDPAQPPAQHALDNLILSERHRAQLIPPKAERVPAVVPPEDSPKPLPVEQEKMPDTSEIAQPMPQRRDSKRPFYYGLATISFVGIAAISLSFIFATAPVAPDDLSSKPSSSNNEALSIKAFNKINLPVHTVEVPQHASEQRFEPETIFTPTLPLEHATVAITHKAAPQAVPVVENALVMFPNSIKAGSIKFLNGNWQAQYVERDNDNLPAMRVQIANGKGNIRLSKGKQVCQATITAGLLPSGTLSMKSKSRARCGDGTWLAVPDLSCKPGTEDIALCHAQWANTESASLTFKKVNG